MRVKQVFLSRMSCGLYSPMLWRGAWLDDDALSAASSRFEYVPPAFGGNPEFQTFCYGATRCPKIGLSQAALLICWADRLAQSKGTV